jgi:putative oxidoreductase
MNIKKYFTVVEYSKFGAAALLLLRLVVGSAFMIHGFGKIQNPMGWMGPEAPTPGIFQALAAVSEFGGGFAWIIGLLTPLAALGILSTMVVAVYTHMVVRGDPFVSTGGTAFELPLVYLCVAIVLIAMGPGCLSLDKKIFGKRS